MFHIVNLSKSLNLHASYRAPKGIILEKMLKNLLRNHWMEEAVTFHTYLWHYPLHKLCCFFRSGNNSGCYGNFFYCCGYSQTSHERLQDHRSSGYISHIMRKPVFLHMQNKGADQLSENRAADQHLCFCYIDSTIPLHPESQVSSL